MFKSKRILFLSLRLTRGIIFAIILLDLALVALLTGLTAGEVTNSKGRGKLAIVIDDFGLQRKGVAEMLELDCKLTAAIMPFLPHTEDDAEDALENGKEIIIHIPMQATYHDKPSHLGPRPITATHSEDDIQKWLEDALEDLPEAVGANIHMGTLCSTKEGVIRPVMVGLKEKNMYFLDSKTSSKSVCRQTAEQVGINFYENQVFLEHESKSKQYIKKRLEKAMKIAKQKGSCIAIGHVGYEGGRVTAEAIGELLPVFYENGVDLVFLSELEPLSKN